MRTSKYFNNFSKYTYLSQKNFLCSFLLICEMTRRDRFFIHTKCPTSLSCTYSKLICLSSFLSVTHIGKIENSFFFSMQYVDGNVVSIFKLFNLI